MSNFENKQSWQLLQADSSVYDNHIFFISGTNNMIVCQECIHEYKKDETINLDEISLHTYWEGENLTCDLCSKEIESAYGVSDNE